MRITATPTTTPTTTPTPTLPALPAFPPREAGEGWSDYGRRAMLYALQLHAPLFGELTDEALEAAADACSQAATAREIAPVTLAHLQRLQVELRGRLAGRQATRAAGLAGLQAWLDASGFVQGDDQPAGKGEPAPAATHAPEGQQGGGGGSKVRRQPKGPKPGPTPAFAGLPPLAPADLLL